MNNEITTQKIISVSVANILQTLTKTMKESHCNNAQIAKFQQEFLANNGVDVPKEFSTTTRCSRKLDSACSIAIEILECGTMRIGDFEDEMMARGFSNKIIRRTKERLEDEKKVKRYCKGGNASKRWYISLTEDYDLKEK